MLGQLCVVDPLDGLGAGEGDAAKAGDAIAKAAKAARATNSGSTSRLQRAAGLAGSGGDGGGSAGGGVKASFSSDNSCDHLLQACARGRAHCQHAMQG